MECNRKEVKEEEIAENIVGFFRDEKIEKMARETKFVQRVSRLTGLRFVKILVMGFLEKPEGTLNHLAQVGADCEVRITPQGIDERINEYSVAFMKAVLGHAMEWFRQQCPLLLPLLQLFSAIRIVDSSILPLPAGMEAQYPGAGGSGPQASLKIQLVFDFLAGHFEQICIQPGRNPDQSFRDYLQGIQAGALILADLGYFCLDSFCAIVKRQAYFLSRYLYPTGILTLAGERIDLVNWLRNETQNSLDIPIQLGCQKRHRIPCRLIAMRVPPEVAQERRRKAIEKARTNHKVPSQDYLDLLAWSLFVTNVPAQLLSIDQIPLFYRLRWQIELLFKLWKSFAGLNAIGPWRSDRILTELYAKLIACVLFQFLFAPLRIPDDDWDDRELSFFLSWQICSRSAQRLTQALSNLSDFIPILSRMFDDFVRFALKQKRVHRPNALHRLAADP